MKKNILVSLLIVVLCVLFMCSCKGDDKSPEQDKTEVTVTAEVESVETDEADDGVTPAPSDKETPKPGSVQNNPTEKPTATPGKDGSKPTKVPDSEPENTAKPAATEKPSVTPKPTPVKIPVTVAPTSTTAPMGDGIVLPDEEW